MADGDLQGVISFSVHPGGSDTPLAKNMPPEFHCKSQYPKFPPQGRETAPVDSTSAILSDTEALPGDTIAFLTSERRPWLGGRWINCNWDMPELMAKEGEIVEKDLLKFKCQGLV